MSESATKVKWTKGAMQAAKGSWEVIPNPSLVGQRRDDAFFEAIAELISRETRDRELFDMLIAGITACETSTGYVAWAVRAKRLLAEID